MKPGWIQTFTGKAVYPLEPKVEDININDIAHALAHLCRFTGHCKRFYTVSEHSWRVSKHLEAIRESREVQLWGLMHDASEAYLQDIARPLKILPEFAFYREAEERLQNVICEKFGLPLEQPEAVTQADMSVLAAEKNHLMSEEPASWGDLSEPAHWIQGTNMLTKWDFLELFEKLTVTG